MIDFDNLFENFLIDYLKKNPEKFADYEEMENSTGIIYALWRNTSLKEIDGKTPNQFFSDMATEELLTLAEQYIKNNIGLPMILTDAIEEAKDEEALLKKLKITDEDELKFIIVNSIKSDIAVDYAINEIFTSKDEEFKNLLAEYLSDNKPEVVNKLIDSYKKYKSDEDIVMDILTSYEVNPKTTQLLKDFILEGKNLQLMGAYATRYKDSSLIEPIKQAAKKYKINYAEFIELRNAVESLGGDWDIMIDVSNDETYKKIKNIID